MEELAIRRKSETMLPEVVSAFYEAGKRGSVLSLGA